MLTSATRYIETLTSGNRFRTDFGVFAIGVASSQVISIAAVPLMTRLYNPEAFGRFGLFIAYTAIIGSFTPLCYELAIVLPSDEIEGQKILKVAIFNCVLLTIIFSALFAPVLWFYDIPWSYLALAGLTILAMGITQSYLQWLNRGRRYTVLALRSIIERLAVISLSVLFYFFDWKELGLTLGHTAGIVITGFWMWYQAHPKSTARVKLTWSEVVHIWKKYRDLPLRGIPSQFFQVSTWNVMPFLLAVFHPLSDVGAYSLATRILDVPTNLITNTHKTVLLQRLSPLSATERFNMLRRSLTMISLMLIPYFALVAALDSNGFQFLFGANWETAGHIAAIMAPMWLLRNLYLSENPFFVVLRRMSWEFWISLSSLVMVIASFLFASHFSESIQTTLLFVSGVLSFVYLVAIICLYQVVKLARAPAPPQP